MNIDTHLKEGEQALAHIWKVTALRGALAIAFSVVILIWPNIGLSALIALFGAFALLSGLATIVGAFQLPIRGGERAWLVVEGLLGIAVGVVVFVWPDLSALGLLTTSPPGRSQWASSRSRSRSPSRSAVDGRC